MSDHKAIREALTQAGILETEDCLCCVASTVYMARKARDVIEALRRDIRKLESKESNQ